ncbi:hypothetical protein BaRGS_00023249 [Batillaria attramentaria]|uniref:SWIM-type domain-containing protein n=1 Tax=Batillaria attramentaria TaxID=370345 RepID=A0ABD0KEH9_9CAEN
MPYHHVELEEKNVPGAILPYKNVDANSCVSLRRWLQTRGLSSTGNKRDLVERVENCIDADLPIDISIDGGKWYQLQCQKTNDTAEVKSSKLPVPPVTLTGWNNFPSVAIPKYFNNGHIYHYIVESACVNGQASSPDEIMDVKTSKPLRRGLDFFKSGHIQDMKDCRRGNFYFCKSTVRASFENKAYDVLVTIGSNTGVVKDGSCDCKASAMGRCSHISGLLQAIADYQSRFGSEACTSKPCEWNKGRKTLRSPKKLSECHQKEGKSHKLIKFDPRGEEQKQSEQETINQLKTIMYGAPLSGWSLILKDDNESDAVECTADRLKELHVCRTQFLKSLTPSACSGTVVEIVTEQGTDDWRRQRKVRITASNCKAVKTAQSHAIKCNVLKRHVYAEAFYSKEVEYGKEKEKEALQAYAANLCESDPKLRVRSSGLWVNADCPELACSPDSIVTDDAENALGLVEVKCPFVLSDSKVEDFEHVLTKKQQHGFCLQRQSNGTMRLKRNHAYYFQVQMQMGVMNLDWCDFFVWTPHSYFVERVSFDRIFWQSLKRSLIEFHHQYLVPEYFEMRIPRGLPVVCLE